MAGSSNPVYSELTKVADNNPNWMLQPYGVLIGSDYSDYKTGIAAELNNAKVSGSSLVSDVDSTDANSGKNFLVDPSAYNYKSPSVSDASIGGNDAINPHAAFCLDDDIVHDVFKNGNYQYGMGRCYSEIYNSKQQIVYLTMGVPKYRNLTTWLKNAVKKELASLNEDGDTSRSGVPGAIVSGIKLAIELPWLPILWAGKLISSVKNVAVTEYFMFRDTMPLYYKYVNTLASHIAVAMGIYRAGPWGSNGANTNEILSASGKEDQPEIMKNGPDIFKIMSKRSERLGKSISTSTDQLLDQVPKYQDNPNEKAGDVFSNFWTGLKTGALEGANFIGFRIERADNASESFSNRSQQSSLAAELNSQVEAKRSTSVGERTGSGIGNWLSNTSKRIRNFGEAVTNFTNGDLDKTIAYLAAGNGYYDLPNQWAGSEGGCNRSLSFQMKLRAKTGGDNVSIFQSIMLPLCCLLAAALPRQAGDTTYTSPFIIRAFCRGMFSVPAGIISSLSITRGASEFGWTLNRLPTVVDVSFTVEDLSPMVFLSMAGSGVWQQAFANNTKLHEYLDTLTGIGCKERYFKLGQVKRRLEAAALASRNTYFSPLYWGYVTGDSSLVRSIMALTPYHRVPNN